MAEPTIVIGTKVDLTGAKKGIDTVEKETKGLKSVFSKAGTQATKLGATMSSAFKKAGTAVAVLSQGLLGLGKAAILAAVAGLGSAFVILKGQIEDALVFERLILTTGFASESISGLENVVERFGGNLDTVSNILNDFSDKLGDARSGSASFQETFQAIGVDINQGFGAALEDTLIKLSEMDEVARSFRGNELFGGAWETLAGSVALGSDAIKELIEEGEKLNRFSAENIFNMVNFREFFRTIKKEFIQVFNTAAPAILDALKGSINFVKAELSGLFNNVDSEQIGLNIRTGISGAIDKMIEFGEVFTIALTKAFGYAEVAVRSLQQMFTSMFAGEESGIAQIGNLLYLQLSKGAQEIGLAIRTSLHGMFSSAAANTEISAVARSLFGDLADALQEESRSFDISSAILGNITVSDARMANKILDEITSNLEALAVVRASLLEANLPEEEIARRIGIVSNRFGQYGDGAIDSVSQAIDAIDNYANIVNDDFRRISEAIDEGATGADRISIIAREIDNAKSKLHDFFDVQEVTDATAARIDFIEGKFKSLRSSISATRQETVDPGETGDVGQDMANAIGRQREAFAAREAAATEEAQQRIIDARERAASVGRALDEESKTQLATRVSGTIEAFTTMGSYILGHTQMLIGAMQGLADQRATNEQKLWDVEKKRRTEDIKNMKANSKTKEKLLDALDEEDKKKKRESFEREKKWRAAQAAMSTAQAIMGVWSSVASIPFPGNVIAGGVLSGMMTGFGAAQVVAINKETPGFQDGGVVGGFQGASAGPDNVNINARRGEMFLNAHQQRRLFSQINNGGSGAKVTISRGDIIVQGNATEETLDSIRQVNDDFMYEIKDVVNSLYSSGELDFA